VYSPSTLDFSPSINLDRFKGNSPLGRRNTQPSKPFVSEPGLAGYAATVITPRTTRRMNTTIITSHMFWPNI